MKIGIDARLLSRNKTGIGRYASWLLCEILSEDSDNDYLFYGYGDEDLGQLLLCTNVAHRAIQCPLANLLPNAVAKVLWEQFVLPLQMLRDNVIVFYSPWFDVPLLAFFSGIKVIFTIHDLAFLRRKEGKIAFRFYYRFLVRIATQRCHRIVTDSEFSKRDIMRTQKVPSERIIVIYNLCFLDVKNSALKENHYCILSTYGIRKPYLLYTGGIAPRKNIRMLLDGFCMIRQEGFEGQLVITGNRSLPGKIRRSMLSSPFMRDVCFTGYVPDSHLRIIYENAMLTIYPSLYEGYGLPVLESMLVGIPVVCSNASSLQEIAGGAASMFDASNVKELVGNSLELIRNEGTRNELKARGFERIRRLINDHTRTDVRKVIGSLFME